MKFADAPDVLTVEEAAQLARVGRNTMYAAVARGDVWGVRIGKSIRIPKTALASFLHTNEAAAPTQSATAPGSNRDATATDHRRAV